MQKARQAIVMGAGIAGLMAARALSDHFEQVIVLEKDTLPPEPQDRRGVPQGQHAHGLLARGLEVMEGYFPGITEELKEAGALPGDVTGDMRWYRSPGFKARFQSGLTALMLSRALLETTLRQKVALLERVRIWEQTRVVGLLTSPDGLQVTGVRIDQGDIEGEIEADLVVDTMGRGSRGLLWLEDLGYMRPEESKITSDIAYASRVYRRREGLLDSHGLSVSPLAPQEKRGGIILSMEGDRWIVTLGGRMGEVPPTDEAGWLEFARSLPVPHLYNVVQQAEPLTEIVTFRFPTNVRRHYERLERFPEGFLVMGDAVCAFNPVYGQGMTSAALQALALGESLAKRRHLAGLWRTFFRRAARVVDAPWRLAASADVAYLPAQSKPSFIRRVLGQYMERLHRAAEHDPEVCGAFFRVAHLTKPMTHLLEPRIVLRVLRAGVRPALLVQPTASRPAKV